MTIRKYETLVPILIVLLIVIGMMEFLKSAQATIRITIDEPIYTIAGSDYSVAMSKGKHVIKLGPMLWGLYPGAVAFKTPEDAATYMKKKGINEEELAVYRLSGNYKLDVNQEGEPHRINKSLMMIEKLKCKLATPQVKRKAKRKFYYRYSESGGRV